MATPSEQLRESLSAHPNEPVLVLSRRWKQIGWDMPVPRIPYAFEERRYLGVVIEPFLNYQPSKVNDLEICTAEYVTDGDYYHRDKITSMDGPISVSVFGSADEHLNRKLGPNPHSLYSPNMLHQLDERKDKLIVEVIVGDQPVTDWVVEDARYGDIPIYYKRVVDKVVTEQNPDASHVAYIDSLKETYLSMDKLVAYQRMRSALGLTPAIFPEDLNEKINIWILQKKTGMVEGIEKLLADDQALYHQLRGIQKIRLPRIRLPLDDASYEQEVQGDEEDIKRIKLSAVSNEQRENQHKLHRAIKEAIEWRLHLDPWIITREFLAGIKTEIDVPLLIQNLAQDLQISID